MLSLYIELIPFRFILVESLTREEDYRREILLQLLKLIDRIQHASGPIKSEQYEIMKKKWVQLTRHQEEMKRVQEQFSDEVEKKARKIEAECQKLKDEINAQMSKVMEQRYCCELDPEFVNLDYVSQKVSTALSKCRINDHHDT